MIFGLGFFGLMFLSLPAVAFFIMLLVIMMRLGTLIDIEQRISEQLASIGNFMLENRPGTKVQ
jgi:hypothetical protein